MVNYEYKLITLHSKQALHIEKELNILGSQGWRVIRQLSDDLLLERADDREEIAVRVLAGIVANPCIAADNHKIVEAAYDLTDTFLGRNS